MTIFHITSNIQLNVQHIICKYIISYINIHIDKRQCLLQDTGFSPSATPTTMLSLLNQHIMFGSETGDGCTVKLPSPLQGGAARGRGGSGGPTMLAPTGSSVLHNAAPVWAFTVANLQQLPQDQVRLAYMYDWHLLCHTCTQLHACCAHIFKDTATKGLFLYLL